MTKYVLPGLAAWAGVVCIVGCAASGKSTGPNNLANTDPASPHAASAGMGSHARADAIIHVAGVS